MFRHWAIFRSSTILSIKHCKSLHVRRHTCEIYLLNLLYTNIVVLDDLLPLYLTLVKPCMSAFLHALRSEALNLPEELDNLLNPGATVQPQRANKVAAVCLFQTRRLFN
jgi:hypothetical protein